MQRNDEGVSPLIATILLIAIAVALGTIVLTISETLAEETIPEAPPSAAFTITDHPHRMTDATTNVDGYYDEDQCQDRLFTITVDEDIRMRDFVLRIGDPGAMFDVWGENETKVGNVNNTFKLWFDGFPAGDGGNDYELNPGTVDQHDDGDDVIKAGQSFILRETYTNATDPADVHKDNQFCATFGFGDEVQVQLVHVSGDIVKDVKLKLQ